MQLAPDMEFEVTGMDAKGNPTTVRVITDKHGQIHCSVDPDVELPVNFNLKFPDNTPIFWQGAKEIGPMKPPKKSLRESLNNHAKSLLVGFSAFAAVGFLLWAASSIITFLGLNPGEVVGKGILITVLLVVVWGAGTIIRSAYEIYQEEKERRS